MITTQRPCFWRLGPVLAAVCLALSWPWPLAAVLDQLSRGVALLTTLSTEAAWEAELEVLMEHCQGQIKRAQLAWQRLSYSTRMSAVIGIRVFGPLMLLLLLTPLEIWRWFRAHRKESKVQDERC